MVQQQRQPQHTAFGDAGKRMHVIQAEGENGASQKRHHAFTQRKVFAERTQNKTPFQCYCVKSLYSIRNKYAFVKRGSEEKTTEVEIKKKKRRKNAKKVERIKQNNEIKDKKVER